MFGDRLREIRKEKGYTLEQLSDMYNKVFDAGLNKGTLSKYENGKQEPMISVVDNLATLLNTPTDYLLGKTLKKTSTQKGIAIPVLGRVAAGIPIEAIEDIIDTEEITEEMAKTGEFFGLQIHGDSMGPKMDEGDIVIVRKQEDAESGDIVIASVNGDDATCKRLRKYRDGIELISSNPSYEPMFFSNEDIIKKPVKIIGKVVELRCKF